MRIFEKLRKLTSTNVFLILLITFSFTNCSRNDDNEQTDDSQNILHPPSWLIGNWKQEEINTIRVTNSTVIFNTGGSETDWAEFFKNSGLPVTETITDTKYTIRYGSNGIYNNIYFTRKSSDKMYCSTNDMLSNFYLYDRY